MTLLPWERAHEWCAEGDLKRCVRCCMLSTWAGAKYACGDAVREPAKARAPKKFTRIPAEERARRVQRAGEMREAGVAYREIARVLGVYPQLAHTYVEAFRRQRAKTNQPHAVAAAGAVTGPETEAR